MRPRGAGVFAHTSSQGSSSAKPCGRVPRACTADDRDTSRYPRQSAEPSRDVRRHASRRRCHCRSRRRSVPTAVASARGRPADRARSAGDPGPSRRAVAAGRSGPVEVIRSVRMSCAPSRWQGCESAAEVTIGRDVRRVHGAPQDDPACILHSLTEGGCRVATAMGLPDAQAIPRLRRS